VKFLFDENLSPSHAARLRGAGYDALAVTDIGLSGASDPEVRATAIRDGRVLITLDADFGNILRYPVIGTPGVIWLRLHPPTEIKIQETLRRCLAKLGNVDLVGKLVVADEDKIRVRG
jgi:predicted nuclease of predicted toxin-antitoxin system